MHVIPISQSEELEQGHVISDDTSLLIAPCM
jgi:hypothetical protein